MICTRCGNEIAFNDGRCIRFATVAMARGDLPAIPWDGPGLCRDCGVLPGYVHHTGCTIERCPGCGGQAFGCPCDDAEVH